MAPVGRTFSRVGQMACGLFAAGRRSPEVTPTCPEQQLLAPARLILQVGLLLGRSGLTLLPETDAYVC